MLRLGLCGFTMAVEDYPSFFDVVELQQTFYQPPREATLLRWVSQMPRGFEFTLKAWQLVTHVGTSPTYRRTTRPLTDAERAQAGGFRDTPIVAEGYDGTASCARTVGAIGILFQCPASFGPTDENVARLRAFFGRIVRPPHAMMLWEPRGPKWVAERRLARALADELDVVHVVDPFVTPPEAAPIVYWRLHGVSGARHVYTDAELERLRDMLRESAASSSRAYVLFNNVPRVGDAKRFRRLMAAAAR